MIGYACLPIGFRNYSFRKVLKKNLDIDILTDVIENNLKALEDIIEYNSKTNIKLFRITSDLIPFGNKSLDILDWKNLYKSRFVEIGNKIKSYNMRVSFHPGQYTVLNSKDENVVKNAISDIKYQTMVLDLMQLDSSNKIILHVGGVYGNKDDSINRFINNYNNLDLNIKKRLVIENDHVSYNVDDLLYINSKIGIPLIFDNLHNEILGSSSELTPIEIIKLFNETWNIKDGKQKIHYSQQNINKSQGSHSKTIDLEQFQLFWKDIDIDIDIDIMLEVKDKDLSVIKCNNLILNHEMKFLEFEWAKYKYNILERNPKGYQDIRILLKDKTRYPILEFYRIIDGSLKMELERNKFINGFEHVWGYFKKNSTKSEKDKKDKYLKRYINGNISEKPLKKYLLEMAIKYDENYLLESYYFDF